MFGGWNTVKERLQYAGGEGRRTDTFHPTVSPTQWLRRPEETRVLVKDVATVTGRAARLGIAGENQMMTLSRARLDCGAASRARHHREGLEKLGRKDQHSQSCRPGCGIERIYDRKRTLIEDHDQAVARKHGGRNEAASPIAVDISGDSCAAPLIVGATHTV